MLPLKNNKDVDIYDLVHTTRFWNNRPQVLSKWQTGKINNLKLFPIT